MNNKNSFFPLPHNPKLNTVNIVITALCLHCVSHRHACTHTARMYASFRLSSLVVGGAPFSRLCRCLRCWNRSAPSSVRQHAAERHWSHVERQPVNSKMDDDLFQLRQLPWVEPIACMSRDACGRLQSAARPRKAPHSLCFVLHSRDRTASQAAKQSLGSITEFYMGRLANLIMPIILRRKARRVKRTPPLFCLRSLHWFKVQSLLDLVHRRLTKEEKPASRITVLQTCAFVYRYDSGFEVMCMHTTCHMTFRQKVLRWL